MANVIRLGARYRWGSGVAPRDLIERAIARVESRERFAAELRSAPDRVWIMDTRYFLSGSNAAGEIRGLSEAGELIGVAAQKIGEEAEAELIGLAGLAADVFVDSGAFSEVAKGDVFSVAPGKGKRASAWIYPEEWARRLALYKRLGAALGPQLYCVAPDKVADQSVTLRRLATYRADMREIRAMGCHVIMPIQRGALSMAEFARACATELGFTFVCGIPMKKNATSPAELFRFVREFRPAAVHLLGIGPRSQEVDFPAVLAGLYEIDPMLQVTCDSARIPAMVGRKGRTPRKLTREQDRVRAELGETATSFEVKRRASCAILGREGDERTQASKAAGWYDVELFASWEESQAWDRASEAERDAWDADGWLLLAGLSEAQSARQNAREAA